MWVTAGSASDLGPGEVRAVEGTRREVVVCRTFSGELRALRGICPHRGGPLRYGRLAPLVSSRAFGDYALEEDTCVLRCPWHAFEFDVDDGTGVADPRFRLQTYPVTEEDGEILVDVG